MSENLKLIRADLDLFLNDQAGAFLYGIMGIDMVRDKLGERLRQANADLNRYLLLGDGDPNHPHTIGYQRWQIGCIDRNLSREGVVCFTLGHQWLVTVFAYWEHECRPRIAKVYRVSVDEIKEPVFGDLRLIRNDILHNKGIASAKIRNCKVLQWFSPDQRIQITSENIKDFMAKLSLTFRP